MLILFRYFTSVFVSLGVFLFGYDQGVMSGIITYDSDFNMDKPSLIESYLQGPFLQRLLQSAYTS